MTTKNIARHKSVMDKFANYKTLICVIKKIQYIYNI